MQASNFIAIEAIISDLHPSTECFGDGKFLNFEADRLTAAVANRHNLALRAAQ